MFSSFRLPTIGIAALMCVSFAAPVFAEARNVVLVHGSWLDGSSWRAVHDLLVADGYRVTVAQLPLTSLDADVASVDQALAQQDGPVVLVGHSYGGAVITAAGDDPDVAALVYVAAFQPDAGESVMDLFAMAPPAMPFDMLVPTEDGFVTLDPTRFAETLGADVPADTMAFLSHAQAPSALTTTGTPLVSAAWREKPVWAVVATEDRSISPDLQRLLYVRSEATVTEVEASHLVILSQPQAVADVIENAAQAAP